MDTGSLKVVELLLIVGVVGYFYLRQRSNLQRLKEEREARQSAEPSSDDSSADGGGVDSPNR
jgi:hypothetical protein